MMRKKISQLFVVVIVSGLFVSCWDNFTERTFYSANITSFVFGAHDSCPDIENYVFNINQLGDTGLIYNLDSLPYGSNVSNLYPTIKIQSSNGNIFINDSLWEDNDSIDFTSPVIFKNTSSDGLITRIYKINVNVHQVDPDLMNMSQKSNNYPKDAAKNKIFKLTDGSFLSYFELESGGLSSYRSYDEGLTWIQRSVNGVNEKVDINSLCYFNSKYFITSETGQLYASVDGLSWATTGEGLKIEKLFGQLRKKYLNESVPSYLIGIAKMEDGYRHFVRSSDGISWLTGSVVDPAFPLNDYALAKSTTVTGVEFYTIATGLVASGKYATKVWSTETGLNWVVISDANPTKNILTPRVGASLFYYDNSLVCFGGRDTLGNYLKDLHISRDTGKGWLAAPVSWNFLKMDEGLSNSQVYIEHVADTVNDKDREYIWIFGGSKNSGLISTVWKAYLNKMVFARR